MGLSSNSLSSLLIFVAHGQRFALPLTQVRQALTAVEITPLPGAPRGIRGVIDVRGEIVPVIDIAAPLGAAPRALRATDHFVIVDTVRRPVALLIDHVVDVRDASDIAQVTLPLDRAAAGLEKFSGVTRLDDSLVLIHDIDRFLSSEQLCELDRALGNMEQAPS